MATLLVWSWRRTAKGEWPRYSAVAAAVLLFNEAILGAMLVVFEHVGMDRSASRAVFLSLHFGNTLFRCGTDADCQVAFERPSPS
jgi:heme a synthase